MAQLVNLAAAPALTRLYSPEDMGLFGLFLSFVGIASVASALRYEVAIVAAPSDEEAAALAKACLYLVILTSAAGAMVFEAFRRFDILKFGALPPYSSGLVAAALLGIGWGTVLRFWAVRQRCFRIVGRSTVYQGVLRPAAQITLAPLGAGGLLFGEAIGRCLGLNAYRSIIRPLTSAHPPAPVLTAYSRYPLVQLPSSLLNAVPMMLMVPMFTALYGTGVAGQIALAQRIAAVPMALVGAAIADVFYSHAAHIAQTTPERLRPFLLRSMLRFLFLISPVGILLFLAAPRLALVVFGEEWTMTGDMLSIMAPLLVIQFSVSCASRAIFLSTRQWLKLLFDLSAVAVMLLIWLARPAHWHSTILIFTVSSTILYLVYGLVLYFAASPGALQHIRQPAEVSDQPHNTRP